MYKNILPAHPWLSSIINYFLQPRISNPKAIVREQTIRYVTVIASISLTIIGIFSLFENANVQHILWHGLLLLFAGVILYFLHHKQLACASYTLSASMILIAFDQSAAYWSPSTVAFTIMYSLVFHIIHEKPAERRFFLAVNLAIYSLITVLTKEASPLNGWDYYSTPAGAILTTLTINFVMFGIAHSIRLKQFQEDQIQLVMEQQQADILRQFLGNASHDLKTILSRIRMQMYFVRRKGNPDDTQHIEALECGINQLEKSLLAMLEMSQLDDQTNYVESTIAIEHLLSQLHERYHILAEEKSIRLDYESAAGMFHIQGNSEMLTRAIDNILKNAVDFTAEGGSIHMELRQESKQSIVISIRDSGKGIAESDLPYIFERFYRGDKARQNPDGRVGLGLSMAQKIIDLHGGRITVESEIGKGSRFDICLPVV